MRSHLDFYFALVQLAPCASFVIQFVWVFSQLLLCQHVTHMEINDFLAVPDPLSLNKGGVGCRQMPAVALQHACPISRWADCSQGDSPQNGPNPRQISLSPVHTYTPLTQRNGPPGQQRSADTWSCCFRLYERTKLLLIINNIKGSLNKMILPACSQAHMLTVYRSSYE